MKFPFKIIDLTHTLNSATPSWSGECGFKVSTTLKYDDCTTNTKFCVQTITMDAGIGTHLDAPVHCIQGAATAAELPINALCAPCRVIDITKHAHESYSVSIDDIQYHETLHGEITAGSCVLMYTGWSSRWHDAQAYRNNHIFPSISSEAAQYLVEKKISGIGIDTLSVDRPSNDFPAHQLFLNAGIYIIENAANLDKMPAKDAYSWALPIKIEGATEAPIRLVGLLVRQ